MTIAARLVKDSVSELIFLSRGRRARLHNTGCRILMYHSIDLSDRMIDHMGLAVPTEVFAMQMAYLRDRGFHVISLMDYVNARRSESTLPTGAIVITFDDGYRSILTHALPILRRYSYSATLFANIHFIEKKLSPDCYWHDWPTLSWEEVLVLQDSGISIGAHAVTHTKLSALGAEEASREISLSKTIIEKNIGRSITEFSYPQGAFNNQIVSAVQACGFVCACTSIGGLNGSGADLFELRRTEITAFDDTQEKFEKKISGCYDWVSITRMRHD